MLYALLIILVLAYLNKRLRFYFVSRKNHKRHDVMKGAEPYFIKKSKKIGVLMFHGFTSTPQELKSFAQYLSKKGITVYAPLIAGHGTHVVDLAKTRKKDWEKSAFEAYKKISEYSEEVYIAGSSFGANLAFQVAEKKRIAGLISMGAPMIFRKHNTMRVVLPFASIFFNFIKKKYNANDKKIIENKLHYKETPLNCVASMTNLLKESEKTLLNITAPSLIMQSDTDYLLSRLNAELIYKKINSKKKKLFFVPDSYHVFCIDKNKGIAFREIYKFIKETSKNGI